MILPAPPNDNSADTLKMSGEEGPAKLRIVSFFPDPWREARRITVTWLMCAKRLPEQLSHCINKDVANMIAHYVYRQVLWAELAADPVLVVNTNFSLPVRAVRSFDPIFRVHGWNFSSIGLLHQQMYAHGVCLCICWYCLKPGIVPLQPEPFWLCPQHHDMLKPSDYCQVCLPAARPLKRIRVCHHKKCD